MSLENGGGLGSDDSMRGRDPLQPVPHPANPSEPNRNGPRWPSIARVLVGTGLIVAGALSFAGGSVMLISSVLTGMPRTDAAIFAIILLQLGTLAFTLLVAASHGRIAPVLGMQPPCASRAVLVAVGLTAAAFLAISAILSVRVFPEQFAIDARAFVTMLRSDYAVLAVFAVLVGAPVTEELAFRGFAFAGLVRAGLGAGWAFLISNTVWTALHAGYSWLGLAEVFAAGLLLTVAYALTRSIFVPILIHATYNTGALSLMFYVGLV
ncbi:MAG: type II CAAX endopeptidase family protein [Pseudomonadota bacterium]